MKIQCPCGAKYAFELTPDLAEKPVKFVCQLCGVDSSDAVNEMIRAELGLPPKYAPPASPSIPTGIPAATLAPGNPAGAPSAVPPAPKPAAAPPARISVRVATPAPAPAPVASAAPAPPSPPSGTRLSISRPAHAPTAAASDAEAPAGPQICTKHRGLEIVHHCMVCKKAMCSGCMEMFGYVCSPFCANKAEATGMDIPVYGKQRSVMERRRWRKIGLVGGSIAAVLLGWIGFSIWYSWFGQVPKPVFSVRFENIAYSGESQLCGENQIVFLHSDTLARYDMKTKKEVWSRRLTDTNEISLAVEAEIKAIDKARERAYLNGRDGPKPPDRIKLTKEAMRAAAASLNLYVCNSNVWVSEPGRLVRYDWDSGKPSQTVPMTMSGFMTGFVPKDNELLMRGETMQGQLVVTHISLINGEIRDERIGPPVKTIAVASVSGNAGTRAAAMRGQAPGSSRTQSGAGLPTMSVPGTDRDKPLDPAKVAEQAASMSGPAKMALPATLSNARNQERLLRELDGDATAEEKARLRAQESFSFIPSKFGFIQVAIELVEERIVERKAMKDPPKKSALEGTVNASSTFAVANEILNEMQRDRGGDTVEEDQSIYKVTVRRVDGQAPDWSGQVTGHPSVHPLTNVNVVASGTALIVLDKMNKKLWQVAMTHPVGGFTRGMEDDDEDATHGIGPVVERDNRLYVADAAMLTAFDIANGNVIWRVPTVGISSMFFGADGMIYLNTTSADPETLKFAKQIDIGTHTGPIVMKIDPKEGKILWATSTSGYITHFREGGKFIYSISGHGSADEDDDYAYGSSGITSPVFFQIRRINPKSGRQMWVYSEERAPWHIDFKDNYIHLVFKKEVEVLKFFSF
jgi:putative pyrroloquinoline-quinone binding quinoprotein